MSGMGRDKEKRMESLQWINDIFAGGGVKRHHNYPIIDRQSVAEHSWRMIVIYDRLWPGELTVDVIRKIVYHDVAEYKTGDVPANAKWRSPELAEELHRLQREDDLRLGIEVDIPKKEFRRFKFCDRLELMMFCLEQRRLGNRNVGRPFWKVGALLLDEYRDFVDPEKVLQEKPATLFQDVVREFRSQEAIGSHVGAYRNG
jgi:5'-deoxynucleotidase YfbR-like HD superfamily hydrolase